MIGSRPQTVRLGSVLQAKYGKSLPASKRRSGAVPVYGSNGQVGWHDVALTSGPTIVIGRKGSSGEVNFSNGPCWPIDTTYFIDDPGPYDLRYATHLLRSLDLTDLDRSSAIPGLNRDELYALSVRVPSIDQQLRIANLIDDLRTTQERIQNHLRRAADFLYRFRQSVMAAAGSGRLTADWRAAHPLSTGSQLVDRLHNEPDRHGRTTGFATVDTDNDLPSSWASAPLGLLTTNHDGKRIPVKESDRRSKRGEYPYYGASGVIDHVDSYLFDGDFLLISEDGANLLARMSPIAFRADGKFWVNNHAHVVQSRPGVLDQYLEIVVNATDIQLHVTGSAQPKLTQAAMNRMIIPLPSTEEQQEIVHRVDRLMSVAESVGLRLTQTTRRVERYAKTQFARLFQDEADTETG